MTESSARPSSVFSASKTSVSGGQLSLQEQDLHLWRCPAAVVSNSDDFKRRVLSHYAPIAPQDWRFEAGAAGKPALVGTGVDGQLPSLQFNVSHSRDWLVCAISGAASVGIDLEFCDPGRDTLKLARRFFHPEEVAAIEACAAAETVDRFYDYWTLKEARVKAAGERLAPALDSYSFELSFPLKQDVGSIAIRAPDTPATVQYLLWRLPQGFRLAVCRQGNVGLLPRVRLLEMGQEDVAGEFDASLRAVSP